MIQLKLRNYICIQHEKAKHSACIPINHLPSQNNNTCSNARPFLISSFWHF